LNRDKNITNIIQTGYRRYEVYPEACIISMLEKVTPDTIIGCNYEDGQLVISELNGQVTAMYYNPVHDSMLVTIAVDEKENINAITENGLTYIPGLYLG